VITREAYLKGQATKRARAAENAQFIGPPMPPDMRKRMMRKAWGGGSTLREIAEGYNISVERARQLIIQASAEDDAFFEKGG
jgi:hypothetical protein